MNYYTACRRFGLSPFQFVAVLTIDRTLDIAALRETPPQMRSGMACVLKVKVQCYGVTCTSRRSSAIGMSHTRVLDVGPFSSIQPNP